MLMQGFAVAGTPENLMIALIGCFIGTVVGLLPLAVKDDTARARGALVDRSDIVAHSCCSSPFRL